LKFKKSGKVNFFYFILNKNDVQTFN